MIVLKNYASLLILLMATGVYGATIQKPPAPVRPPAGISVNPLDGASNVRVKSCPFGQSWSIEVGGFAFCRFPGAPVAVAPIVQPAPTPTAPVAVVEPAPAAPAPLEPVPPPGMQQFDIQAGPFRISVTAYGNLSSGHVYTPAGVTAQPVCNSKLECDAATMQPALGSQGSGADVVGIFSVNRIQNSITGQSIFIGGGPNGFLTGIMGGFNETNLNSNCDSSGCGVSGAGEKGFLKIFHNADDFKPQYGAVSPGVDFNAGLYPGISDGNLYLSTEFVSGAVPGDPNYTFVRERRGVVTNVYGYMKATGGYAAPEFSTATLNDYDGGKHDMYFLMKFEKDSAATFYGYTHGGLSSFKGATK